jgi:2-methylisocitrate lyase-like PEP mutase family enzyme
MTDLNQLLRSRLQKGAATLIPGAPNAVAARIIEQLGFAAAYVTGAGVANSFLGAPDIGLLTLTEMAQHVAAIRENVTIPLVVDADTGFGNAINVTRTIKVLERAGANAIQLEDQVFPKRCGHFADKSVIPMAEMVAKVKAAADAREDAGLIIIARTDAIAVHGIDDALERAARYIEAGADMTFVEAPRSLAEIARIPSALPAPQLINIVAGGLTPMLPQDELGRLGFAMVLYANAALQAAMRAMKEVLTRLQTTGSLDGATDLLMDFAERQDIVGKPHFDALDRRYAI